MPDTSLSIYTYTAADVSTLVDIIYGASASLGPGRASIKTPLGNIDPRKTNVATAPLYLKDVLSLRSPIPGPRGEKPKYTIVACI
jgi:hypothetical protein